MAQPEASGSRRPLRRAKRPRVEGEYTNTPWMDSFVANRDRYSTVEDRLHDEIIAFSSYIEPTTQEVVARKKVTALIIKECQKLFSDADIVSFGSASTGLVLPDGDIDLAIISKSLEETSNKDRPLFRLSSRIKSARLTADVQVNHHARVPIITFTTFKELGQYSVDIGVNNVDGSTAVDIVNNYLATMPALKPLILLVKSFLSQREMNSAASAGLGSYAVICMCISFLQLNPLSFPPEYITSPMPSRSLGNLFMGFLTYYGSSFPYTTACISVTQAKLLSKAEMQEAGWVKKDPRNPGKPAIQCLINPENDVGKSAGRIKQIKTALQEGHKQLVAADVETDNASVLCRVIGISEATVERRAFIRKIVDDGTLDSVIKGSGAPPRRPNPSQRGGGHSNNNNDRYNHTNYKGNSNYRGNKPNFSSNHTTQQPRFAQYDDSFGSSSSFNLSRSSSSHNSNHNNRNRPRQPDNHHPYVEEGPATKKQRKTERKNT